MLLASFFFALMNVGVKYLPHLPAVEIAFFRSLASLVVSFAWIRLLHVSLPGKDIPRLILRGVFGAGSLILYFITLQRMPLASAVTIQFLSPVLTTVFGIFIVKESVRPVQWLFFAMAFAGVFIIEGFDTRVDTLDVWIGIGSAVCSALAFNTIRLLRDMEHPLVIILYFPLITLPISGFFMMDDFIMPHPSDWPVLFLIGVFAQIAQYFMTRAYQGDPLSKVSSMKYLGIIYALIFGFVLFDETFSWEVYAGIVVVLTGVVMNLRFKERIADLST